MAEPKIPVDLILSKLVEDADKASSRVHKASDVLLSPLDTEIAATPYEIVHQEDRVKLKHYTSDNRYQSQITVAGGICAY